MIAIIDYGVGNLFSLVSSFKAIGADAVVTNDIDVIRSANKLILPGVGAFRDAAKKLRDSGMDKVVLDEVAKGKPLMGICLGMQLLFDKSYEYGEHGGLGLIKGSVIPFKGRIVDSLKVPHIGWNAIKTADNCPIFRYIDSGDHVYFVHSYFAEISEATAASAEYGINFTAAVWSGNVYGCQFHPEKSGEVGLNILRGFNEIGV